VIRRIARYGCAATGAAAIVAAASGCGGILTAPIANHVSTAPLILTARATPSMLVVVTGAGGPTQLVGQVVTATARPREDLDVLEPNERGRPLIASTSPAPARMAVPGRPPAPGRGASSYQEGQYQHALTHWQEQMAATKLAVAVRTKAAVAHWARSLRPSVPATGPAGQRAATLPRECSLASSTVSGLVNQAGSRFGGKVVLLSAASLSGMPTTGELDGDDVIVVTSYVPSAAAASAAQLNLLAAGASFAAVLGPEVTPAQLDHLVAQSLSGRVRSDVVSGQALFADNSATLRPTAARVLAPIVTSLRRPGASGVVNGFASTPGSPHHNEVLSQDRASAVATYLEARGISRSSLVVVGHGASNLVAPGSSGDNRRVVVVIEEPVSGGT
jgi:outer membrane protein OmpA-like peptidoglycan-associated protein